MGESLDSHDTTRAQVDLQFPAIERMSADEWFHVLRVGNFSPLELTILRRVNKDFQTAVDDNRLWVSYSPHRLAERAFHRRHPSRLAPAFRKRVSALTPAARQELGALWRNETRDVRRVALFQDSFDILFASVVVLCGTRYKMGDDAPREPRERAKRLRALDKVLRKDEGPRNDPSIARAILNLPETPADDTKHLSRAERAAFKASLVPLEDLAVSGRVSDARGAYVDRLQRSRDPNQKARLWYEIGLCEQRLGNSAEALRAFQRAAGRHETGMALTPLNLGMAWVEAAFYGETKTRWIDEALRPMVEGAQPADRLFPLYETMMFKFVSEGKLLVAEWVMGKTDPRQRDTTARFNNAVLDWAHDYNYPGPHRDSMLHTLAVASRHDKYYKQMLEVLVDAGANIEVTNRDKDQPFDVLSEEQRQDKEYIALLKPPEPGFVRRLLSGKKHRR